jgi:hypothetical protein
LILPALLCALAAAAATQADAVTRVAAMPSAEQRDVLLYLGEFDPELDPIDLSEMPPLEETESDQTERKRPHAASKKNR